MLRSRESEHHGQSNSCLDAVIIGTGFGGIAMAVQLKRAGITGFAVLEKAKSVGGTWRDNRYPGAGCDVPSVLYSLSFAPKGDWSRKYPLQEEIEAYLAETAASFDINRHIRFNFEVTQCQFDQNLGIWRVYGKNGEIITARVVISAVGQLSQPSVPAIPGQNTFRGRQFHSACWDYSVNLAGKSVAVVGNGASAIQFVPRIAPTVAKLTLFQRSPSWVFPKPDRPTTQRERILFRYFSIALKFIRLRTFVTFERGYDKYIANSEANINLREAGLKIISDGVSDVELRKKLTPDYVPGCKRILISNEWYPAITRKNVSLVTTGLSRFEIDAAIDGDGQSHTVDVVIYATGFKSTQFLTPMKVTGLNGRDLHQRWLEGAEAYNGVAVPDFPNFFIMYGPNTNTHNSIIFMLESQAGYVARKVKYILRKPGRYIVPKVQALQAYYEKLDPKFSRFAWTGDCDNWYRVPSGRVVSNWPERSLMYRLLMLKPDRANYDETVAPLNGDPGVFLTDTMNENGDPADQMVFDSQGRSS